MAGDGRQAYPDLESMLAPAELSQLLGRPVAAVERVVVEPADWSSTDACFEAVHLDDELTPSLMAKTVQRAQDWVAIGTHDSVDREVRCWEAGLLDRLPAPATHAVVAATRTEEGYTLLMHELSDRLVPNTQDTPVPLATQRLVLDALAAMHVTFWMDPSLHDPALGLSSLAGFMGHTSIEAMARIRRAGVTSEIVDFAEDGWRQLPAVIDPGLAREAAALARDPTPLVEAAASLPWTLVHADPRSANLAIGHGQAYLLDWGRPAVAPPALDLAYWLFGGNQYLAIPHDRLVGAYEASLRSRLGARFSEAWWEPQLQVGLLAVFVAMAPFITYRPDTLPWWTERARSALRWLGSRFDH